MAHSNHDIYFHGKFYSTGQYIIVSSLYLKDAYKILFSWDWMWFYIHQACVTELFDFLGNLL